MAPETPTMPPLVRELYGLRPGAPRPPAPPPLGGPRRGRRCPSCGGTLVHRDLARGWRERLRGALLGSRPYRCVDCGHRFWDRPRPRVPVGLRRGASPVPPGPGRP